MTRMMTAAQAMSRAIERALCGDVEISRLWLDIARELRCGSGPVTGHSPTSATSDQEISIAKQAPMPDQMYGYVRGQSLPPTNQQYSYAKAAYERRDALQPWPADASSLAQEILTRYEEAARQRAVSVLREQRAEPSPDETAHIASQRDATERVNLVPDRVPCRHCGAAVLRDDLGRGIWVHRLNRQRVCARPNLLGDNDSTMVHTYAEPVTP